MLAVSGVRASFGVFIKPIEAEFGWSRGALSGVAALSLLLLGASGPFVGRLADRWAPRRVVAAAVLVVASGMIASAFVQELWQIFVTVGLLVSIGSGGLQVSVSSTLVSRWFEKGRGLALGITAAGLSAGQLLIIPLATALMLWLGWRGSYFWLGLGLLIVVLPLGVLFVRDSPEAHGLRPYGATGAVQTAAEARAAEARGRVPVTEAARSPQFWLLMGSFFVCGYTTFGVVLTHFVPHALEHNFTQLQASSALGVMGAMNVLGTIGSGWFCDRFGRRGPLATYYFVRGLSLLFLLYVWDAPSLYVWAAIFGLNYISTVPPTTALTATIFGRYSVGELSGWIYFSHQVGASLGALLAGWIFEWTGSYGSAFVSGAVLAFIAAALVLAIREEPATLRPTTAAVPA
jgi:MFS family permease